jgi:hypothetical protein
MEKGSRIFPEYLVFCRSASSSYLALSKFRKGLELKEKDRKAIRDAIDFLNDAKYGKKAIDSLELGQHALTASYAFKEAFTATLTTFNNVDMGKVLEIIENFIGILHDVAEDKLKELNSLDDLIKFFARIRERTLESSASSFDKVVTWGETNASDSCSGLGRATPFEN